MVERAVRQRQVPAPDEPSPQSDVSYFDATVLEALAAAIGWPDALAILDVFLADAPPRLAKLRQDAESGDAVAIGRHLHALKSAAGSLGFTQLARLGHDLQATGALSAPAALSPVAVRVEIVFWQCVAEAAKWRAHHEAGHATG